MSSQTIWDRIREQPFTPFRLRVSDGQHYDIRHPEMIVLMKQRVNIFIYDAGTNPREAMPIRAVTVSPLHVTSVEDIPAARPRRRRAS